MDDDLLTTTEAARLLRCSRQHVVDLCEQGVLPHLRAGTHRRIRRRDLFSVAQGRLRREEERSWWLHHAVAGRLVADPGGVMMRARANLAHMRQVHDGGEADQWLDQWQAVLDAGSDAVLEVLTSRSAVAVEMRQNTPFAGILTDAERMAVLAAFSAGHRVAA
jgi:excisionase family DNA binding protein